MSAIRTSACAAAVSVTKRSPQEIRAALWDPAVTDIAVFFEVAFRGADDAELGRVLDLLWKRAHLPAGPDAPPVPASWTRRFGVAFNKAVRPWPGASCIVRPAAAPGRWEFEIGRSGLPAAAERGSPPGTAGPGPAGGTAAPAAGEREAWITFEADAEARTLVEQATRGSGWMFIGPVAGGRWPGVLALREVRFAGRRDAAAQAGAPAGVGASSAGVAAAWGADAEPAPRTGRLWDWLVRPLGVG